MVAFMYVCAMFFRNGRNLLRESPYIMVTDLVGRRRARTWREGYESNVVSVYGLIVLSVAIPPTNQLRRVRRVALLP